MSLLLCLVIVRLVCLNIVLSGVWHLVDILCKLWRVETFTCLGVTCKDALLSFHTHSGVAVLGTLNMRWDRSMESVGLLPGLNLKIFEVLRPLEVFRFGV